MRSWAHVLKFTRKWDAGSWNRSMRNAWESSLSIAGNSLSPAVADCQLAYKQRPLTKVFQPDFICFDKVVVEIKAVSDLTDVHRAQVHNYLKATGLPTGHSRQLQSVIPNSNGNESFDRRDRSDSPTILYLFVLFVSFVVNNPSLLATCCPRSPAAMASVPLVPRRVAPRATKRLGVFERCGCRRRLSLGRWRLAVGAHQLHVVLGGAGGLHAAAGVLDHAEAGRGFHERDARLFAQLAEANLEVVAGQQARFEDDLGDRAARPRRPRARRGCRRARTPSPRPARGRG